MERVAMIQMQMDNKIHKTMIELFYSFIKEERERERGEMKRERLKKTPCQYSRCFDRETNGQNMSHIDKPFPMQ